MNFQTLYENINNFLNELCKIWHLEILTIRYKHFNNWFSMNNCYFNSFSDSFTAYFVYVHYISLSFIHWHCALQNYPNLIHHTLQNNFSSLSISNFTFVSRFLYQSKTFITIHKWRTQDTKAKKKMESCRSHVSKLIC